MKTFKQILEETELDETLALDLQLLRDGMMEEIKAVTLYEQKAFQATDPRVKELYLTIAKEEKIHIQEFEGLIEEMDPEYIDAGEEADKEAAKDK